MSLPDGINEPLPFQDAIANPQTGQLTDTWANYFERTWLPQTRAATVRSSTYTNGETPLSDALTTEILEVQIPVDGMVLLLAALAIVVAAGVSSSVSLTMTWTWRGVARSETFGPITNGTTADQLGVAFPFLVDGGSPVTIETTYASNPANAMQYDLQASVNLNGLPVVG